MTIIHLTQYVVLDQRSSDVDRLPRCTEQSSDYQLYPFAAIAAVASS
jgi:hypothetical protein